MDALDPATPKPPDLDDAEPIFDDIVIEEIEAQIFGPAALVNETEAFLELIAEGF